MPRCPHCNYALVLLEHRRKYKCAKCSRLHSQKEIDDREFVIWNKQEREKDKQSLTEKKGKQKQLTEFEKRQKMREYYLTWRNKNPDSYIRHYNRNKERILARQKEYRNKNGQALKEKRQTKKMQNIEEWRRLERIKYLRLKQRELAQEYLEFEVIKAYKTEIDESLPTFALSDLLPLSKDLKAVNNLNY